jgi:hypothetical protein
MLLISTPSAARAQWYFQAYLGGNHTQRADIHIVQPSTGVDVTYGQVSFEARSLKAPQYYGYRLGRTLGKDRRVGIELEFTHLKVIAETGTPLTVTGQVGGAAVSTSERMDERVGRYSMSHGLNFIVANVVWRTPLGGGASDKSAIAFVARGGLGPTLPHAETVVSGIAREQYEWGGLGLHAAAGFDLRLHRRLSAFLEYKLGYAKPTISIANGTGQTTALTHQIAVGLGIGLTRPQ